MLSWFNSLPSNRIHEEIKSKENQVDYKTKNKRHEKRKHSTKPKYQHQKSKTIILQIRKNRHYACTKKTRKENNDYSWKIHKTNYKAYKEYNISLLALEKIIQREHKIHIPHNTIYEHMLDKGQIIENPKKKKQRKWVRYEREHSLSWI